MKRFFDFTVLLAFAVVLASCSTQTGISYGPDGKPVNSKGEYYNPFEPGTYDHFKAQKEYPKTSLIYENKELLGKTNSKNSRVVIKKGIQRAFLMNGEEVAMDYPVSTGKSGYRTPSGKFKILGKSVTKESNTYGSVFDEEGKRVYGKETPADVPEGGSFKGASMPYWMRLTNDGIGMHIGYVARSPVSHGCIRGPRNATTMVYKKVAVGTPVEITD